MLNRCTLLISVKIVIYRINATNYIKEWASFKLRDIIL